MPNNLCSPYNCNICLMLKNFEDKDASNSTPIKSLEKLLTCSGCQLVRYCDSQHQKMDWPLHKEFCQAVQRIKKISNVTHPFYISGEPRSREEVEKAIILVKYLLCNALGRGLEYQEEEFTSFPAYCAHCFKFKSLKTVCSKCLSQAYCKEQHKELHKGEHDKVCGILQTYYSPYKLQPIKEDFCIDMNDKLEDLLEMDLVEAFQTVFGVELPVQPCQDAESYQLFSFAADFSCIMSICYAISQIKLKTKCCEKFVIFILGASIEAVIWFREMHCKLFFQLNPEVIELVLDFIGPEVIETRYKEIRFFYKDLERTVKLKFYKGLFQDYCKYYKIIPNLMVAFNCGFSEFSQSYNVSSSITDLNALEMLDYEHIKAEDIWYGGLVEIVQTFDTPIIFTSFTEQESQFDFASLKNAALQQILKVHIERIFKISKNPFHDLRPLRQWYTRDKEEFFYRNGYIQAVRTKLEKNLSNFYVNKI